MNPISKTAIRASYEAQPKMTWQVRFSELLRSVSCGRSAIANEHGSVLITALILGVVLIIMGSTFMMVLQTQMRMQNHDRAKDDYNNLITMMGMLFTTRPACSTNLVSGGFGTSASDVQGLSQNGSIQVLYPANSGTAGPASGVMLKTGAHYNHLIVRDVKFQVPLTIVEPASQTYLGNLQIDVTDTNGTPFNSVAIPFYLDFDPTAASPSCFATTYITGNKGPTIEDMMCNQLMPSLGMSGNFMYSPAGDTCVNSTMPVTGGP